MSSNSNASAAAAPLFRRRLMRDINELCRPPCYPNIKLHPPVDGPDGLLGDACLLLTTKVYGSMPLHLTVRFPNNYPVAPPQISMDTPHVSHPNIYGSYICASILNTAEGYTSAYTLKAIAIQMLSFFSSDSLEQTTGRVVSLARFQNDTPRQQQLVDDEGQIDSRNHWKCERCCYHTSDQMSMLRAAGAEVEADTSDSEDAIMGEVAVMVEAPESQEQQLLPAALAGRSIDMLTDDVLLLILQELDATALNKFMAASDRVRELVEFHDVLRQRELQCFCLKSSYMKSDLGVGVSTLQRGAPYKRGLESEFDLLSREAFATLKVRRSVQSIEFDHWLPLPLSRRHWLRVRNDVVKALDAIGEDVLPRKKAFYKHEQEEVQARGRRGATNGRGPTPKHLLELRQPSKTAPVPDSLTRATEVLLSFMTQIVVRLNEDVDKLNSHQRDDDLWAYADLWGDYNPSGPVKSTLRFASEKAIESYFHLFHLLVCLAAEHPQVADDANRRLRSFYVDNRRSKADCPNLGMLLVALLISDDAEIGVGKQTGGGPGTREDLLKAIITEAIKRNVVWLLDSKGAGRAELVHLEPNDTVSAYRLHHTFVGSQTSYRLLMFMELFRRTARPGGQSLEAVRDGLYQRHGAPPAGAAADLAAEVRRLQKIQTWPDFLVAMGVSVPSKSVFCNVLRKAVRDSMGCGYSVWALTAAEAKSLREYHEDAFAQGANWKPPVSKRERAARSGGRGRGRGRGGRGGASNGVERTRPVSVDHALRDMAEERYRHLTRGPLDGPRWTSMSASERESAAYVQWRLQSKEVSFFPGGVTRGARDARRRTRVTEVVG